MTVVLMYHALFADSAGFDRIDVEDQPYAVSKDDFIRQLDLLAQKQVGLLGNAEASPDIVLTFDDGHVSNYELALPLLAERSLQAYFFVTTDFIESRRDFCSPAQIREMSDAKMIIGSHGKTHKFFADLSAQQAKLELTESKQLLESITGQTVESISFPGGRYQKSNLGEAARAGYRCIFGSDFGAAKASTQPAMKAINRIPVRLSTGTAEFEKIVHCDRSYYLREKAKFRSKQILKQAIGNQRYHALYEYAAKRR